MSEIQATCTLPSQQGILIVVTSDRGTRGRNRSWCSNRRTIPAVNRYAHFGGWNPSRSRITAIAFGVSPRPCRVASRTDKQSK